MPVSRGPVDVEAVHPEVRPPVVRMPGENQRKRDERPAVFGPGRQHRQPVQVHVGREHIENRARCARLHADRQRFPCEIARAPELPERRRHQRFRELHEALDQPLRPRAERHLGAARGPEQVRHQREARSLHAREQQRGPARGDHAPVNLGHLESCGHGGIDDHEIAVAPKLIDEVAQVRERPFGHGAALC
jgi:hypothetical protein